MIAECGIRIADFRAKSADCELGISDFGLRILEQNRESISKMLSGFNDLPGFQAASADADALRTAVYKRTHGLKIWIEASIRSVVSVAYGVTKLRAFVTDFASFCHCSTPLLRLLR
jgi:hypothetical protein